jgi:hypothetical protein
LQICSQVFGFSCHVKNFSRVPLKIPVYGVSAVNVLTKESKVEIDEKAVSTCMSWLVRYLLVLEIINIKGSFLLFSPLLYISEIFS